MNIFKLGRGELFGIIMPGAFLFLNIVVFHPLDNLPGTAYIMSGKSSAISITVFIVLSYTLGFSLRLIKPDWIEKLTFLIRIPYLFFHSAYFYFFSQPKFTCIGESRHFISYFLKNLKIYWERFPYIDWFYDYYLNKSPVSVKNFWENLCEEEFSSHKKTMKSRVFINQCKLYVRSKSVPLNEELMFREGLVRFISGMSCAFFFSACIILYYESTDTFLFWLYGFLFVIFGLKLRYIRFREVGFIFTSFAYSMMDAASILKKK
jgi:hypothetical protein